MHDIIIQTARSWLGTPFKHQGRLKHIGCDCLGLVIGVLKELGITINGKPVSTIDEINYSIIPDGKQLQAKLDAYLERITLSDAAPGDILLMRFNSEPQHIAILSNHPSGHGIIHAYLQAGKVVEHNLDEVWRQRLVAVFRVPQQHSNTN